MVQIGARVVLLAAVASSAVALRVTDAGAFSVPRAGRLPIENKDAFFVAPPTFFGIFDGVSACPQSRAYAQALAKTSLAALQRSGSNAGDFTSQASAALSRAASEADNYSGASTAMILRMDLDTDEPQVCGFNVGDCTCMVLRPEGDGKLAVDEDSGLTTPRFHENGAPFQLAGRDWQSDSVSDGDSFAFGVGAGSVVLCCTDGLTCNLSPADVATIVSSSAAQPAKAVAEKLANEAKRRGVVEDDVTVIVWRLGDGPWTGGDLSAEAAAASPLDAFTAAKAAAARAFKDFQKLNKN